MKKGISLVSLAIIIIVMVILAGVVVFTGFNARKDTTINMFALEILNIQNAVDSYKYRYEKYPVTIDHNFSIEEVQLNSREQFEREEIINDSIRFKVLDLSLLGINDTEFGKQEFSNDMYVVSEKTGKVYYLAGIPYENITYYTLVEELNTIVDLGENVQISSKDIKMYDVIFTPSNTSYTNKPVTVLIKLPNDAIIIGVTTTNSKSVSEETIVGKYKQIEVNNTSEDKTGNYTVTVEYTYNGMGKIAEYVVDNYDDVSPQFTTLMDLGNGYKTIKVSATDDYSGIKTVRYVENEIPDNETNDAYFQKYSKVAFNSQFIINSTSGYTIYVEDNAGNIAKTSCQEVPDDWKASVITMYDGVPIPKGFVPSQAEGENTKEGGLVIYEGTGSVTGTEEDANNNNGNVFYTALRTRNQYVWVPVDTNTFKTAFIRKNFGMPNYIASKLGETEEGTSYGSWEVEVDSNNIPLATQDTKYMTSNTLAEVQAMYASVKKYGGFYVARYEAGIENYRSELGDTTKFPKGKDVYSRMNKYPYNYIPWALEDSLAKDAGGAVEVARSIYTKDDTTYGAVSTLIYGVQWDTILQWWLDTGAVSSVKESRAYGNYDGHNINAGTADEKINKGASYSKYLSVNSLTDYEPITSTYSKNTAHVLTTGALKAAKVNNIYDMAGNLIEYTMEGGSKYTRNDRGGMYRHTGEENQQTPVAARNARAQTSQHPTIGFRVSLYIK